MLDAKRPEWVLIMDWFISIDIGTTNTKGALMNTEGHVGAHYSIAHLVQSPESGWAEHDMEQNWWLDPVSIIRKLLLDSDVNPNDIRAVMLSGMSPSLGFTDEVGVPLRKGITQSDIRTPVHTLEDFGITPWDHSKKSTYIIPRLLWIMENEPEIYSKIRKIFFAHSYLYYRLTSVYAIDFNTPCYVTPLYNCEKRKFDRNVFDAIGLTNCELPLVKSPINADATISAEAATLTGLSKQTKICVGTGDFYETMMAAGLKNPGDGLLYFGSVGMYFGLAEDISSFLRKPTQMGQPNDPLEMGPIFPVSGILLEWYIKNFAKLESQQAIAAGASIYSILDDEASKLPIGADKLLFLPHLNGERNPAIDPYAKGVLYGLRLDHGVANVYRAIMESYCFSFRHAMEEMIKKGEISSINRVSLSGGGAKSPLWRQITSDVLGVETVFIPKSEETTAGCYLAAMSCGVYDTMDVFFEQWLKTGSICTVPIEENRTKYDLVFNLYKSIYERLRGSYSLLNNLPE